MKKKIKFLTLSITFISFTILSIVYLLNLERFFIFKIRIQNFNINFPIPVLFFATLFIYTYCYSKILNKKFIESSFFVLPIAIFWQISFFIIELIGVDPWGGGKAVFTVHSYTYLTLTISSILVIANKIKARIALSENKPIIIIPYLAFIVCLVYQITKNHAYKYFLLIPIFYFLILFILNKRHLIRHIYKKELLLVLMIFILAFMVRLGWGLRLIALTGDQFYSASDDGITYALNAQNWVKGIGGPSAFGNYGGFLYTIFLGVVYKLFGNPNYYAAVFFQSILGSLVPICVYFIAKRITNVTIACISAIIVCLNMNNIFTSTVIGMEALFIPLVYMFLLLLITYIDNGKIKILKYSFLVGVLLGLANIVRLELTLFFIVVAACFYFFSQNRFKPREVFKITAAFIFGFLFVLTIYCSRNYIKEGKFDFRTDSAAVGFCLSDNRVVETKTLCNMGFNPFSDLGKSIRTVAEHPMEVSSLLSMGVIKKGFNYLFCANFGEMDLLMLINNAGIQNAVYRFSTYFQFYIYLFSFAGLIILIYGKKHLLEKSILAGYMAYTILFYAIIYTMNARYRAVLEPLFIILFVNTIYFLTSKFKKAAL